MQVARPSLSSSFPQGSPPAQPAMYHNSPHGPGLMAAPGFNRSFSQQDVGYQQHGMEKPQIYTVRALDTKSRDHANMYRPSTRASVSMRWR
jgi:hypothetical protein